ncbi:hypothetical protein tb265_17670 [Gemmatimonadetes bacterium T265]|nr:hypothetical protein tb265_17670 [Gemmatimonadetes bacterium T265]
MTPYATESAPAPDARARRAGAGETPNVSTGPAGRRRRRIDGLVVGTLTAVDVRGRPRVAWPATAPGAPVPARSVVPLGAPHVGREVALLFDGGDARRPVVMGVLEPPRRELPHTDDRDAADVVTVEADDERVVLTAEREIVLRCGEASITLTRAGKVLIKGEYVLTRANGVNRIRGGSVQIN